MRLNNFWLSSTIIIYLTIIGCASSDNLQVKDNYRLERVVYNIEDDQIRETLEKEKEETSFKLGQHLDKKSFDKERNRIERIVKKNIDNEFNKESITFNVDTTLAANKFSVEAIVMRNK